MKKIWLSCAGIFACFTLFAQLTNFPERCGTMHNHAYQLQQNPHLSAQHEQTEQAIRNWLKKPEAANKSVITIPVVVHVVYVNNTQDITDQQIQSQIDALNADYRRQNADKANTRPIFDSIAADIEIQFCLAATDPNGAFTTGIIRKQSPGELFGFFTPFDGVKSSNGGIGSDPWPTTEYLNIWVCPLIPGLLGYAQFPGGNPATDGVVVTTNAFGTIGTVQAPSNKGRTSTHEIGHWLGLRHIWGDGDCDSTDYVEDTPNANGSSSGCDLNKNTCANESSFWGMLNPPDMVENYMDYSEDACMNAFTKGQKDRMWAVLNTSRSALLTSMNNKNCYTVSVEKINATQNQVAVFPVPAKQQIQVQLSHENMEYVYVYDLEGRQLLAQNASGMQTLIDCSNLASGIYTLRVVSKENTYLKKFVKE